MPKPDKRDFEERYTACFVDFGLKVVTGLILGSMLGGFFLRGYRKWPMYIGGGLGFGMAYTNCENSLNNFLLSMDPKTCSIKSVPNWKAIVLCKYALLSRGLLFFGLGAESSPDETACA